MASIRNRGLETLARLRGTAGRWCLAAAVSGLAGTVSLYNAAMAHDTKIFSYCKKYATPSCSSCPKNAPNTSTTACSQWLNGWKWGVCTFTFSSTTCYSQNMGCSDLLECKTGTPIGACDGGGVFNQCR